MNVIVVVLGTALLLAVIDHQLDPTPMQFAFIAGGLVWFLLAVWLFVRERKKLIATAKATPSAVASSMLAWIKNRATAEGVRGQGFFWRWVLHGRTVTRLSRRVNATITQPTDP